MKIKNTILPGLFLSFLFLQISCAPTSAGGEFNSENPFNPGEVVNPDLETLPNFEVYPLLWESAHAKGRDWTQYVIRLLQTDAPDLMAGAQDVQTFCPRYQHLSANERINFWALLVSAMVKYESNFDPTTRLHETTMGTDPVTGKPVYSEGLLQLSYQDTRYYRFCAFDWSRDKHLNPRDPRKTILDPYRNLHCGVKILNQQIRHKKRITLSRGVYWAVLRLNGKNTKIPRIAQLTKKMPGCM